MTNAKDSRVIVIAEIGVNHNGSLKLAKELIDQCAVAGADYAKFQTFTATDLASADAKSAGYQRRAGAGDRQIDLLTELELTQFEFRELVQFCSDRGIGFLTTAHDLPSARFVIGLQSDYLKVPSGDVTNLPLLRLFSQQRTPVLLSTGASEAMEVSRAVEVLQSGGLRRSQITVMQCTSEYPAPFAEANLQAMVSMGRDLGVPIGYSDHTDGVNTALAAVALGATVIEKHITLDRTMPGPDHRASLEPREFQEMVIGIHQVTAAMGSGTKTVVDSERHNRMLIRKSIVAAVPISAGEVFSEKNLCVMRPGGGLSPMRWESVLGQQAERDYGVHEMIGPG